MNMVNSSTGYSGFQLWMGRLPHLMPPVVSEALPEDLVATSEADSAKAVIETIHLNEIEAQDNLLMAKVHQVHFANEKCGPDDVFVVGELVMLSTLHHRNQYKKKNEKWVAKFLPRFDGSYKVIGTHPETSNYTLEMPNTPKAFPTFHASELKRHVGNDAELFPHRENTEPGPILAPETGLEEYTVESIIDSRKCGRGWQYLVQWVGYGPEHDRWLPRRELEECEALDRWLESND